MSRLRVLAFGRYADSAFGGVERHVQSLASALADDVSYVDLVAERGLAPRGDDWDCEVVRAPALFSAFSTPICPTMPWLARALDRQHRFDLLHLHLPDPMSHLAALCLPRRVPVVITWHSDIVRQRHLRRFYLPFLRSFVAKTGAVIAATPAHFASMAQLTELTRPDQRAVIPYGFDFASLRRPHPLTDELRRRYGKRIVFALGRHVYYKGFEYLLRAMADVPDAVLLLGGSGPLTGELQYVASKAGVADRVMFAGTVPDAELGAYYQACNVFCLPSVEPSEAFGIVQVEAMACGKPVVCADLKNGVTWVNEDGRTGLVVPPRDAPALAAALRRLLDDSNLAKSLGSHAAIRAEERFSLAALREGTLAVYRKVLARPA